MTISMSCEQFENILPDLLDDVAAPAAMTPAVRAHLDACSECRALLADLNSIRSSAAALPVLAPSRDLWAGIASRIETPVLPLVEGTTVRAPRRHISWRAAGIAAGVLVVANFAAVYGLMHRKIDVAPIATVASAPDAPMPGPSMIRSTLPSERMMVPVPVPAAPVQARRGTIVLATNGPEQPEAEQPQQQPTRRRETAKVVYDREITRLRAIVDSGRTRLDPATVAQLDRNLKIIDTAIEQVTEALGKDPSSTFLLESLNNAYQTKVKLLRIAAAAASRG